MHASTASAARRLNDDFPWRALLLLILLAVGLRGVGWNRPLLGNFASKSTIYAQIARNFARGEAPLHRPTLDLLLDGRKSWHLQEIPLAAYLSGELWIVAGGSLDAWGRVVSIACSALNGCLLFLLVRRFSSHVAAWGAALAYLLSPVSIIYGQTMMLEASVVTCILVSLGAWDRWASHGRIVDAIVGAVFFLLGCLTKSYLLVLLLPMGWLIVRPLGPPRLESFAKRAGVFFAGVSLALIAVAAWYLDLSRLADPAHPDHARVMSSLVDSVDTLGSIPRFWSSPEWYRRGFDDLATVLLGPLGFSLALLGLTHRDAPRVGPWLASAVLLVFLLPRKFYELNYYGLVILPPLATLVGLGLDRLSVAGLVTRRVGGALFVVALAISLRYAIRPAFVTPPEDRSVIAAAEALRELAPPGEPIATLHGTAFDLLYYCDRPGWVLDRHDARWSESLYAARLGGARRLVATIPAGESTPLSEPSVLDALPIERRGEGFVIYDLAGLRP